MEQKIIGFHLDTEDHWVADLACGHKCHVRHDPPMEERHWVLDAGQRQKKLGSLRNCKRCDEVGLVVARQIHKICLQAAQEAYEEAGVAGLCMDGQLDLILDRLKTLNLKQLSQEAIAEATTDLGTLS